MRKYLRQVSGMMIMAVLVLAGVGWVGVAQGQEYTVREEHPRMWVTADTIADLRARKDLPGVKEHYDALVSYINSRVAADFYDHADIAWASSFLYLCTGDSVYSDKAIASLESVANHVVVTHPDYWFDGPDRYKTAAVIMWRINFAYDWVYNQMSENQKDFIGQAIAGLASIAMDTYRHSDYNNHFYNFILPPIVFAGLALYNNGYQNATAIELLNYAEDNIKNHTLKAIEQVGHNGGGWHENANYAVWAVQTPFILMLEAWNSANDEDLFLDVPSLQDFVKWLLYIKRPHDSTFARIADIRAYSDWVWAENMGATNVGYFHGALMPLLASKYNDPYAQWFASNASSMRYYTGGGTNSRNVWHIPYVIWYDPDIPTAQADNSLPLTEHFEGLGWVVMRTGFESSDDTFAIFKSGPYYNSHQHSDENSFVIHKQDSLAIDSGYYEWTDHKHHYYERTIAHNNITIYKPGEILWDEYGPFANDGGQFRHLTDARQYYTESDTGTHRGNPIRYDKGKVVRFESQTDYDYSMGDATNAYYNGIENDNKINNFTRQFVFLRPDYFIVFDRVSSKQSSYAKKWLLHSETEPDLDGTETVIQGGGGAGISESTDSSLATIANGTGKLFSKTLLPENHITRKVGGSGYEFWVDGRNYPPTGSASWIGAWRIEVEPVQKQEDNIFLHVLYPTDSGTANIPETKRIDSQTNNMVGTQIADPSGPRITMFSRSETKETGGLAESIIYNVSGQGTSKHLIADLKPNTNYDVSVDGSPLGTFTTTNNGILNFNFQMDGVHSVVIGSGPVDTTAPGEISYLYADTGTQPGTVDLTWTATGDDDNIGTATAYIIRYSVSPITSANWDTATDISGEPSPQPAGSSETFTVTGLTGGTTYYFAIKARDEVGNTSNISNSPSAIARADNTPPVITGISTGNITATSVVISWQTDEPADSQVEYGVTVDYGSATNLDSTLTVTHSQTMNNLTADTLYHYRVRSRDGSGNLSESEDNTFTTAQQSDNSIFSDIQPWGNADNWAPLHPNYWEVSVDPVSNDKAYFLKDNTRGKVYEYTLFNPASYTDFTLTAKVRSAEPQSDDWADYIIIFAYQDPDNYYFVFPNGSVDISANGVIRRQNGTDIKLSDPSIPPVLTDRLYHNIELIREGNDITFKVDGTVRFTAQDSTFTTGKIGLGSYNDSVYFDDVNISTQPTIRGDVNGDGVVNIVDVQLAVNQFLGVLPQTQEADLNGDGVVNVIDVQQLVNIILGG